MNSRRQHFLITCSKCTMSLQSFLGWVSPTRALSAPPSSWARGPRCGGQELRVASHRLLRALPPSIQETRKEGSKPGGTGLKAHGLFPFGLCGSLIIFPLQCEQVIQRAGLGTHALHSHPRGKLYTVWVPTKQWRIFLVPNPIHKLEICIPRAYKNNKNSKPKNIVLMLRHATDRVSSNVSSQKSPNSNELCCCGGCCQRGEETRR